MSDSTTSKYKDRLVAKSFHHQYGIDFDEIFSIVVKITTLQFLLGVLVVEEMELIQPDVKTTSLHCDLEEEIYMEQPVGVVAVS